MLLELATKALPSQIGRFEYRAYNPMLVNRPVILNTAWNGKNELDLWAADKETGTIGMAGMVYRC
jgi:hydroxyacyl-ACP dehydratase HTD2-like protein with hotdog domain